MVLASHRPQLDENMERAANGLHDRLVQYVHALSGEQGVRGGVWREHSYARANGRRELRVLLGPPPRPASLDVCVLDPVLRPPADDCSDDEEVPDEDTADDDWEARLAALAPTAAHARLATATAEILRSLRLARLAQPQGRARKQMQLRQAANRLRRALAPLWATGAGAWLCGAVGACAPAAERALFAAVGHELLRAAPALAARLPLPRAHPRPDPLAPSEDAPAVLEGPVWLCWVVLSGRDARWAARLRALLPLRAVRPPRGAAPPDQGCAAALLQVRHALSDLVAEAQAVGSIVAIGGAGGGAMLAAGAVRGARGLVVLGPALRTADAPAESTLQDITVPTLLVAGGAGARGTALSAAAPTTRVLLVEGTDDSLLLPSRIALQLNLPQHALDAAIAEEVARWAAQLAAVGDGGDVSDASDSQLAPAPSPPAEPPPQPAPAPPLVASSGGRSIEIIEGRVVSRGAGGTPLPLPLPRRLQPPAATAAPAVTGAASGPLAAADILQLPIVFADDQPPSATSPATPKPKVAEPTSEKRAAFTVTTARGGSALKYTRVIVAKRADGAGGASGGAAVAAGGGGSVAVRGGGVTVGGGGGPRAVVVRRALRVLPRARGLAHTVSRSHANSK